MAAQPLRLGFQLPSRPRPGLILSSRRSPEQSTDQASGPVKRTHWESCTAGREVGSPHPNTPLRAMRANEIRAASGKSAFEQVQHWIREARGPRPGLRGRPPGSSPLPGGALGSCSSPPSASRWAQRAWESHPRCKPPAPPPPFLPPHRAGCNSPSWPLQVRPELARFLLGDPEGVTTQGPALD